MITASVEWWWLVIISIAGGVGGAALVQLLSWLWRKAARQLEAEE